MAADVGGDSTLAMVMQFVLWYALNAGYNVYNQGCKVMAFPYFVAFAQLAVGLVYCIPLWVLGIRKAPKMDFNDVITILPIVILNAVGHSFSVVAMFEKGGGSFTHVIKASEPVVSAILGLLINGAVPKPLTSLSLLPITYGVAYASTLGNLSIATMSKELTTKAATYAMIGNISFALRSIMRKRLPAEFKARTNMTAQNDHAVTTILSALVSIPMVLYLEGFDTIKSAFTSLSSASQQEFYIAIGVAGLLFYLYNEIQNMVLSSLGPVPTAVGNTLKRVVIFVALFYFTEGETFPEAKIVGCAIAVAGCLAFAIFDSKKM